MKSQISKNKANRPITCKGSIYHTSLFDYTTIEENKHSKETGEKIENFSIFPCIWYFYENVLFSGSASVKSGKPYRGEKKADSLTELLFSVIHLKVLNSYSEPEI